MTASSLQQASQGAQPSDPSQANGMSGGADMGESQGGIDPSQGYQICINVGGDNTISVSVEPGSGDSSGASGAMGGSGGSDAGASGGTDQDSQQVPNIHAAMQVVMDIYKHAGQMNESGAEQDAMTQAYGSGS